MKVKESFSNNSSINHLNTLEIEINKLSKTNNIYLNDTELKKIHSTLNTFSFLFENAKFLSSYITVNYLNQRINYLVSNINEIPQPDCPELDLINSKPSINMINYQKINRYLCFEIDEIIKQNYDKKNDTNDLAYPIIEWSVNVFTFLEGIEEKYSLNELCDFIIKSLKEYKISELFDSYFKLGYECVKKKINEISKVNDNQKDLLLQLLKKLK